MASLIRLLTAFILAAILPSVCASDGSRGTCDHGRKGDIYLEGFQDGALASGVRMRGLRSCGSCTITGRRRTVRDSCFEYRRQRLIRIVSQRESTWRY